MALKFDVVRDDLWYKNTDFVFKYRVWQRDRTTPRDVTGYALSWMLKTKATDADASAILTKTSVGSPPISIQGIFHVDPALNTQEVWVPIADTDTTTPKSGVYHIELKRTDPGAETVLSAGLARLLESGHQL
jgi:hypothetical protein